MTTTIKAALRDARQRLQNSDTPSLDAQVLLCAVLKVTRAYLLAHPEEALIDEQADQYAAFIARREGGEPVAYILGERAFYDLTFTVTPDVLIPRPETELLLERALTFIQAQPGAVVVDVGTGSGALAVTLARHAPTARIYATDISKAALAVARGNAARHGVTVTFFEGDLLRPIIAAGVMAKIIVANLPYIDTTTLSGLAVSRYEPHTALDGGADGLDVFRRLLRQVPQVCQPDAVLLLEIGADQGKTVPDLARSLLSPREVEVFQDYAGLDRIVQVQL